ncbi:Protein MRPL-41 [Aphelenchoides avenae]|nr:Protein MRPL-41 [Aphelenchus avenae]
MVRSINPAHFRPPWPFIKKGAYGWRKIGPMVHESHKFPGQNKEFPELNPKWQKNNDPRLHNYMGDNFPGYKDPETGECVLVKEMIPELIVPDLSGFKLGPYVSYKTDVAIEKRLKAWDAAVKKHGSEEAADLKTREDDRWPPPAMTAKTLFDYVYAPKVRKAFRERSADALDAPTKRPEIAEGSSADAKQ